MLQCSQGWGEVAGCPGGGEGTGEGDALQTNLLGSGATDGEEKGEDGNEELHLVLSGMEVKVLQVVGIVDEEETKAW